MKRALKRLGQLVLAALLLASAVALIFGWKAFGHRAEGARLERMKKSPQWLDGAFENPQPLRNKAWGSLAAMFESAEKSPSAPMPVVQLDAKVLETLPATGLRITWLGHSTSLIELDGKRFLTDPIWSERSSPLSFIGPTRWYEPLIALEALPPIDAVLISHDHFDHLDYRTIVRMKDWKTTFIVPLGVGAHLEYWGVPPEHIVELDWWEPTPVGDLQVVCTPARHASGRSVWDKDAKLWAGYAVRGPKHRVYYSGDTGLFPAMDEIGRQLGPFDATLIETGQYNQAWPDWHIGPEQAVIAHEKVKGKVMFPIHWGLFQLASHGWTEPVERAVAEAHKRGVAIVTPRPGEGVEPEAPNKTSRWWPEVKWRSGAEDPIVSTQMQ